MYFLDCKDKMKKKEEKDVNHCCIGTKNNDISNKANSNKVGSFLNVYLLSCCTNQELAPKHIEQNPSITTCV